MKRFFRLSFLAAILGVALTSCSKDDKGFVAVSDILDVPVVAELNKPLTLTATVLPANATNKTIVWTIKDAGSTGANITVTNVLTATTTGSVTVTATIVGGATKTTPFTGDFSISVRTAEDLPAVTDVTVTPSTANVVKGGTQTFTATVNGTKLEEADKTVYWTVTGGTKQGTAINDDGTLTVAADETAASLVAKATSKVDNTKSGTANVTISATSIAVTDITLNLPTTSLIVGKTLTLTPYVQPENATDKFVTWKSSNPAVASVVDGVVIGLAPGMAVITATTRDGSKTDDCTVTVTPPSTEKYMTMTFTPGNRTVSFHMAGYGTATIHWGNGESTTHPLSSIDGIYSRIYSYPNTCIITIIGEDIRILDCYTNLVHKMIYLNN